MRQSSTDPGIKIQLSDKRRFKAKGRGKRGRPKASSDPTKLRASAVITVYGTTLEELRDDIYGYLAARSAQSDAPIKGNNSQLHPTHQ